MDTQALPDVTALNPERHFLLQHVGFDKRIVRAQGHYLYDDRGTRYLDALAQYGALPFGHNPSFLWETLEQIRRSSQPSFVQPLLNPATEALARELLGLLPHMARVTFVNSGAEATEVAIKLARARTGRRGIVTVERGFHGKTNAALCATANRHYRDPFLVDEAHFATIPFGDLDALEASLASGAVAAFIVEAVQGEGGMRSAPPGYLLAAQEVCRRRGTLLVLDEVQAGLGRTGKMFGFEHHGPLEPDVVLLAKALGGGLVPLGAVLCTQDAWTQAFGMLHSSTFANSHLTTAIGCATLAHLAHDDHAVVRNARDAGAQLRAGLEELQARYPSAIRAVHGEGLMLGVELAPWSGETSYFNAHASHSGYAVPIVAGYLLNTHRVLTAPTFNSTSVLRVQPSLTITREEIDTIVAAIERAVAAIAQEDFAELFSPLVPASPVKRSLRAPLRLLPPIPAECETPRRRFAFLVHPTDDAAVLDIMPASVSGQDEGTRRAWLSWMSSWSSKYFDAAPVFHLKNITSHTGASAEGWLIGTLLTPEQMVKLNPEDRLQLMTGYLKQAARLNVDIIGLGAFTSVITMGGSLATGAGIPITTGNSLTGIASAESLLRNAALRGQSLVDETFAVVGAAGSVGRIVALHLARNGAARIRLVGNPESRRAMGALKAVAGEILIDLLRRGAPRDELGMRRILERLGAERCAELGARRTSHDDDHAQLYDELVAMLAELGAGPVPVTVTTDIAQGVRGARFVVTATSAGRSFITSDLFMENAIVCDVARPLDVLGKVRGHRDDVFVFEGGLVRLPMPLRFGIQNILGSPDDRNLACLSETMVLALDGAQRHYSIGNRFSYEEALHVYRRAEVHGFTPHVEGT
jgi:acetylornithine/succinyldiaminopimelate/putrescine aminotransferase/predicted amino acid dehydrogenase